ncbi:ATP-independent periplasmic protein-refolding chaperone Spy [Citrobacter sp. Awk 4]|uniref:ATP-independent periplasmic protein-refolding chaperone Spy n=1 Tax=Citrobacter sp. Awk 4 TaxID=2963955 RepID=UPI002302F339|nr:ATP-independent periplasmic protein-refolding chaperone Spy [Citrobacter sp. Awk 4]MDA8478907.1 ATP-independent periplasmic protein-refolding chaperone Spy [Citrobacter sp. Awk 4]
MRKLTALFVASTLALGAANLAHAADTSSAATADSMPMMHHKGKFGPHHDMMFKDLNLTDAQKQQIREIMKGQRDQMKRPPLEERRAMHDIITSDTFDKAKAQAQIAKMEEQRQANMLAHMETQNKIYNILTPEQKKQFNANFEKRLTERPAQEGKMPASAE